ncbi:MAG: DNA repair protein RecO [Thermoleophilia bacterium]|jgi:DNA repair protein RecO (recombination protein O)
MPRTYSTEAVVLGSHKLGDADRVVTLFTRDHGKTPTVVKGVRKIKSRFGGRLEPFTHLAVQLHEGRNLHTLTGADTIRTHASLRDNTASLRAGLALVDMLGRASADFERRPRTFNLVINYLDVMEKLNSQDSGAEAGSPTARQGMISVTLGAELKLLLLTGFLPHLANCASCGAEDYLPRFSAQAGGALCENCGAESFDVSGPALDTMRRLLEKPLSDSSSITLTMETASEVWNCIREICRYHLGVDLKVKPW